MHLHLVQPRFVMIATARLLRTVGYLAMALIFATAPILASTPAWAQSDPPDAATTALARVRFKEGVTFYDAGKFEQARVSFLQAYALKRHPLVLINVALSCLKSGHAVDASRDFRQFLIEARDITDK